MKQTIKVKVITDGCAPQLSQNGEWIDLRAATDVHIDSPYANTKSKKGGETTRKVNGTSCWYGSTYSS